MSHNQPIRPAEPPPPTRSLRALAATVCMATCALMMSAPAGAAGTGAVRGLPDFSELVDRVGPSVVNIRTLAKTGPAHTGGWAQEDEAQQLLRRFFGIPLPKEQREPQQQQQQQQQQPRGVGSGFVLSADGYIMTNAHVLEGADQVLVTLADQREFTATVIGADKRTDVAVVKIATTGLPAVKVGNVLHLKVGEWVVAIGSPFGLANSVTAGIVSAKQRDTGAYLPFIQTDVAINPGNSGGPLINMRGEVVGINSQIYSRSGGFMGISFAIPIDEAMRVSEQLQTNGHVSRGRLGVQIDTVKPEVADSIGLGPARGALIRAVERGSPAEKAGIEAGDILLTFDGKAIEKASDLPRLVGHARPGTQIVVRVFRHGAQLELKAILAAQPTPGHTLPSAPRPNRPAVWGLTLSDLSDTQKRELGLRGGAHIDAITPTAARAGLQAGDVIVGAANVEILTAQAFEAIAKRSHKQRVVSLLIRRGEATQYLLIKPTQSGVHTDISE